MANMFRVVVDTKDLMKLNIHLGAYAKQAPVVVSRALNRAATTTRSEAVKEARNNYYVKAAAVRATFNIRKSSKSRLTASVCSKDGSMPLDKFKFSPNQPRPKNPPAALKVGAKKPGMKELRHAFVANINGTKIFERTSKKRLPIKRLMGPPIPRMVGNQKTREVVERKSLETYEKRLDHEIKRVLEAGK
ncbi:MAG: hypothetical protein H6Q73_2575 [Firmicutes bacterium]|nr:hypothetical protein [Bacillota bacterium]